MPKDRRPANRLRQIIDEGVLEFERTKHRLVRTHTDPAERREAIARCGRQAPWDDRFLVVCPRHYRVTPLEAEAASSLTQ
jgi:hypothetical protein